MKRYRWLMMSFVAVILFSTFAVATLAIMRANGLDMAHYSRSNGKAGQKK